MSGASATLMGSLSVTKAVATATTTTATATASASLLSSSSVPSTPVSHAHTINNENIGLGSYNYGGLVNIPGASKDDKYGHRDSECTAYTSATEVRERESIATVVKGSY